MGRYLIRRNERWYYFWEDAAGKIHRIFRSIAEDFVGDTKKLSRKDIAHRECGDGELELVVLDEEGYYGDQHWKELEMDASFDNEIYAMMLVSLTISANQKS